MTFKEALDIIDGLRFAADKLNLRCAPGRNSLMSLRMLTSREDLEREFLLLNGAINTLDSAGEQHSVSQIIAFLSDVRDIHTTIQRLAGGATPDDIELFEIKGLALADGRIKGAIEATALSQYRDLALPDLAAVVEILDPERNGNAHFHIYDAYSPDLREARLTLKHIQDTEGPDSEKAAAQMAECMRLEEEVRTLLGIRLLPYAGDLQRSLLTIGKIDLLLAKAEMARELRLTQPKISEGEIKFTGLRFLPLEEKGAFQPVDITLPRGVTLITGANMGGKTITLRSLALAQALAQFAFFVPAAEAEVALVENIALSIGDSQSTLSGLSSYGAEILKIDGILSEATAGKRMLILIDEPARTTNPEEGKAIVEALIDLLGLTRSFAAVTTHYSNIGSPCRRLKVRGLRNIPAAEAIVSPGSLQKYMDYTLEPDSGGEVEREALKIGRMLGISEHFADAIEKRNINNSLR